MSRIAPVDRSHAELSEAREAGRTEADIVVIITRVGMKLISAMLDNASHVEIDFPRVSLGGV